MRRFRVIMLSLLLAGAAAAQSVRIDAELPAEMTQGGSARATFDLQLLEAPADLTEGVWFLNVVEPLQGGEVRQMTHLLFSAAREEGKLFRQVFSRAELEAGISTTLEFELRRFAPTGEYLIALQLFNGRDTNPGRVKAADRVAMEFLRFSVLPAQTGER